MVVTKPEASDSPLIADKLTEGKRGSDWSHRSFLIVFVGLDNYVEVSSDALLDQRQRAQSHKDTASGRRVKSRSQVQTSAAFDHHLRAGSARLARPVSKSQGVVSMCLFVVVCICGKK